MRVLFKNITRYDKENCNSFINFHTSKYGKKQLIRSFLVCFCFIYILIFNIIYKNWFFLEILILLSILIYYINKKKKKRKIKEKKIIKEYTFYFYKRYIKVRYRRKFDIIPYFKIKRIFETNKNFFLYTDDTHSLIIDKEGFVIGNQKEFSKFMKNKYPFKYSKEKNIGYK